MNYQQKRSQEWDNLDQRLENYKNQHAETAKSKGLVEELKAARTLTKARKVLFGEKTKKNGRA